MNFRQLEVFHAIMTSRSLTEASRRLNVSQPSVSAVLKRAEDQLGVSLFNRLGGRLVPTPEADEMFPEVDRIFAQLRVLERVTTDLKEGRMGYLPLVGSPTLANALLLPTISAFKKKHPRVRFRIEVALARQGAERIAAREFDLGLVYGSVSPGEEGAEVIGKSEIVCVMPADHPLAKHERIGCRELLEFDIITFYRGSPVRNAIEQGMGGGERELNVSAEVSVCATACQLARQGAGVALIDALIFKTETFADLVVRPFDIPKFVDLKLLYPTNRARSRLSLEFQAELKSQMIH